MTDGPPQDALVERDLQVQGSGGAADQRLPRHPDVDPAADLFLVYAWVVGQTKYVS